MGTKYCIGVFDSGAGGLNVLKELKKTIVCCNYTYFADIKNIPYGTKSDEKIISCADDIIQFFLSKNISDIVIACNTVSAIAYSILQEKYKDKVNLYPVLQCGIFAAKNLFLNMDSVAVFATKATVKSHQYKTLLQQINPSIKVLEIDCTGFVEIVENNTYQDFDSLDLIKSHLEEVKKHDIKNIILGCTHYSYLLPIFKNLYAVNYINPAFYLAQSMKDKFPVKQFSEIKPVEYFVSSNPEHFKNIYNQMFGTETINIGELVCS